LFPPASSGAPNGEAQAGPWIRKRDLSIDFAALEWSQLMRPRRVAMTSKSAAFEAIDECRRHYPQNRNEAPAQLAALQDVSHLQP
jgi:hypothetical protein